MKKYLLISLLILVAGFGAFGQEQPIAPVVAAKIPAGTFSREKFDPVRDPKPDLDKAVAEAGKSGKRIILDIGGEWCGWCVYMDKFFFQNPELSKFREDNYVWVKVNFSVENENKPFLSPYPPATGYPHLYVLDETGKLLHSEDTSLLEQRKGYDLVKFTKFLKAWAPSRAAN